VSERLFGTDGVRGIPGREPLTTANVAKIAAIAARLMKERQGVNGSTPFILMGRDTRGSGPELARALVSGFAAAGCRTVDLGVIPTPGVAYLVPRHGALCGVVISASHNPAEFNGIKFFDGDGFKMDPLTEDRIETKLRLEPEPKASGKAEDGAPWRQGYLDFLKSTFPATLDLSGMKLVVDCANGAASGYAKALFESLGAQVFALSCSPNGRNINADCGALYPAAMQKEIVRRKADCGVCFDGDADRALFADETGALLDGDALICFSAGRLRRQGLLHNDRVVLTIMSNIGLVNCLKEQGVGVTSVPVGDRNVTEAIEREHLSLGGEASGHIIFRRFAATGDGMLTGLQTLAALRESGRPLSDVRKLFRTVPQILQNLEVERKPPLETLPRVKALVKKLETELKGSGRIVLRYSGTEPLLRIMIEGPSQSRIKAMAQEIADVFLAETTAATKGVRP
jgi:phosphoglucosamine mutase